MKDKHLKNLGILTIILLLIGSFCKPILLVGFLIGIYTAISIIVICYKDFKNGLDNENIDD